jgi:hypothetical protein
LLKWKVSTSLEKAEKAVLQRFSEKKLRISDGIFVSLRML